ncbi:MAG TPA: hypothetical protein VNL77_09035 [Roseiflexaceae bacterium]|nr:hypothetical protein [Roseiflexaceae bacterium]
MDAAFAHAHHIPNTACILAAPGPGGLRCLEWCGTPMALPA